MKFIKPCDGRLTSGFRTSDRPDHHGVDFAKSGLVEVKAVANGRVMRSYASTTYGEVIFILHNMAGQEWESVYAHLREGTRRFKEGTNIKQGEVLGLMGNTGRSFGQHLHFELHKGRWNINKTNAVDPMNYLEKEDVCKEKGKTLYLPSSADTWTVYQINKPPVKSNKANYAGTLKPSKFGGLEYEILGQTQNDVYIINTANFGKVQIYAHPSTGAIIK